MEQQLLLNHNNMDAARNDHSSSSSSSPSGSSISSSQRGRCHQPPPPDELFEAGELSTDEKRDLFATLEHLIIAGNHHRHRNWRIQEWKLRQQKRQRREENPEDAAERPPASNKRRKKELSSEKDDDVHAQDLRLYSNFSSRPGLQTEPHSWPKEPHKNIAAVKDNQWDLELSDSIHPVYFTQMRLVPALEEQLPSDTAEIGDKNRAVDQVVEDDVSSSSEDEERTAASLSYDLDDDSTTKNCTITRSQTAQTFLNHCWERAVHAAASTVGISRLLGSAETTMMTSPQQHQNHTWCREFAVAVCQRLQIRVPEPQTSSTSNGDPSADNVDSSKAAAAAAATETTNCHVCGVDFLTFEKLEQHFYGNSSTRGCCWIPIQRKRQAIITDILRSELQRQQQQLIRFVLMESQSSATTSDCGEIGAALTWNDVLTILERKIATARKVQLPGNRSSQETILDTLEVEANEPPLPINRIILETVRNRLIDRYGKVPR